MHSSKAIGPAVARAVDHVRSYLSAPGGAERRLPSVRTMARDAGVSLVSMWKAVNVLVADNVLECRQRQGIFIPATGQARALAAPFTLRDRIQADVLNGFYDPGARIPSVKLLCVRYGAGPKSVARALRELVADGLLDPVGRGFVPRPLRASVSHGAIVLVTGLEKDGSLRVRSERREEYLSQLETLCERHRVRLAIRGVGGARDALREKSAVGYLLWSDSIDDADGVASELVSSRLPVAVLDESDSFDDSRVPARPSPFRVFCLPERGASREVARYLLLNNHERIAFISPYHACSWSQDRFAGLVEAYASAGLANAVTLLGLPVDHTLNMWRDNPPLPLSERRDGSYRNLLRSLGACGLSREQEAVVRAAVEQMIGEDNLEQALAMLFEEALGDRAITAWVCLNDRIAGFAWRYLRARGVRVPQRLSLVAFDNSRFASVHRLTSYSFCVPEIASRMVSYVLAPGRSLPGEGRRVVVDGLLLPRGSSARRPVNGVAAR